MAHCGDEMTVISSHPNYVTKQVISFENDHISVFLICCPSRTSFIIAFRNHYVTSIVKVRLGLGIKTAWFGLRKIMVMDNRIQH